MDAGFQGIIIREFKLKFPLVSSEFFLLREALGVSFGLRFLSTT